MDSPVEKTCVICVHEIEFFCIGMCNHPVCFECNTRMRILCGSKECPICRCDVEKVYMTKYLKPYTELEKRTAKFIADDPVGEQYGFLFENEQCRRAFRDILAHACPIEDCPLEPVATFNDLKHHVRTKHDRFYCDLCVEHLKLFPWERRCYSRKDLATHRREGDRDDGSHKGHPICRFCDVRFLDHDALYRQYTDLRVHFLEKHYLCEEGECRKDKFTNAFNNEIDFKAHKARVHGSSMNKTQLKQEKALNLEFNYPSARQENQRRRGGKPFDKFGESSRGRGQPGQSRERRDAPQPPRKFVRDRRPPNSDGATDSEQERIKNRTNEDFVIRNPDAEFPSLGPKSPPSSSSSRRQPVLPLGQKLMANAVSYGPVPVSKTGSVDHNEFPSLDAGAASKSGGISSQQSSAPPPPAKREPRQGLVMIDSDDFPTLPGLNAPTRPHHHSIMEPIESSHPVPASGSRGPHQNGTLGGEDHYNAPSSSRSNAGMGHQDEIDVDSLSFKDIIEGPLRTSQPSGPVWDAKAKGRAALPIADPSAFPTLAGDAAKLRGFREAKSGGGRPGVWSTATSIATSADQREKAVGDFSAPTAAFEPIDFPSMTASSKSAKTSQHQPRAVQKPPPQQQSEFEKLPKTSAKKMKQRTLTDKNSEKPNATVDSVQQSIPESRSANGPEPTNAPSDQVSGDGRGLAPPGLKRPATSMPVQGLGTGQPPPGFGSCGGNTPPGFGGSTAALTENDPDRPPPAFIKPPAFTKRNQLLFMKLERVLTQDSLSQFKVMSGSFRKGRLHADDYYRAIWNTLGTKLFCAIFQDLLTLLPNIERQHALLDAHQTLNLWTGTPLNVIVCPNCGQVVIPDEYEGHRRQHTIEEMDEFPALGPG